MLVQNGIAEVFSEQQAYAKAPQPAHGNTAEGDLAVALKKVVNSSKRALLNPEKAVWIVLDKAEESAVVTAMH